MKVTLYLIAFYLLFKLSGFGPAAAAEADADPYAAYYALPVCSDNEAYLLADASGALIIPRHSNGADGDAQEAYSAQNPAYVIMYRADRNTGWASRTLLSRFDLAVQPEGTFIENSGGYCRPGN